jgi:glycosyltransferase involved in cell wall biosynthesis
MQKKLISFVVAVFRNEGALTKTYEKIKTVFNTDLTHYDYEVIFIDDGSDDNSLAEALSLRENDPSVKVMSFTRNFGQMAAMLAGFKRASGNAVINVSADLQDPVELVKEMAASWEKGAEIVVCYRVERADKLAARLFSRFAYGLLRMSIKQLPLGGFDFVLMDRKVMDAFNAIDIRNRFFQGDLLWSGYRASFIPYARLERKIGKSQYNFWKKIKNFTDAFLDASYLPIRAISCLGLVTSLFGFAYSIAVIVSRLFNLTPFPGYAPLMIAILVIGGLILVTLGIIGEYIWRIYDEVRKKPNYVIREEHF